MKIIKSFSIVAILTLLSSVLGYIREATLAAQYGASAATDAYFAAFFIPNTLYLILLSGSISTIFVPIFVEYLSKDDDEAWYVASSLFNVSALLLSSIILICVLTVHYWIFILFPGFDKTTIDLAIDLTFILLPMLLFIGLSSFVSAVLNSFEHFTIPALAPIIANIFIIIVIVYSHKFGGIYGVSIGVTIGMFLQLALQFPKLIQMGAKYHFVFDLRHPALKRIWKLSVPLVVYLVIAYASLVIERNIASTLPEGTLSDLNYAVRVFSIPIAFTAGAVGTVIYPRLSLDIANHENEMFSRNVFRSITASLFFLAPISLWLIANAKIVINLLFGYGKFTPQNIQLTSAILIGYTVGMVPTGIARILQRASYALQDTISPLWSEIGTLAIYFVTAPLLTHYWGVLGLGIARGISFIFVMFALMVLLMKKHKEISFSVWEFFVALGKYFFASALAIITFHLAWSYLLSSFDGRLESFLKVGFFSGLGFVVYVIACYLLKLEEMFFVYNKLSSMSIKSADL